MYLDDFLEKLLENLVSEEVINKVKKDISDGMKEYGKDYKSSKVEHQVLEGDNNYTPKVVISSDGYNDGEVIFIDCEKE